MNRVQLDQQRADMLEALYQASGRTCCTYTGLWEEFSMDLGANFRDTDYAELHAACVLAIGEAESHLADKHAQQCIHVCRQFLLGKWGNA
jgi:hypothetical protein